MKPVCAWVVLQVDVRPYCKTHQNFFLVVVHRTKVHSVDGHSGVHYLPRQSVSTAARMTVRSERPRHRSHVPEMTRAHVISAGYLCAIVTLPYGPHVVLFSPVFRT